MYKLEYNFYTHGIALPFVLLLFVIGVSCNTIKIVPISYFDKVTFEENSLNFPMKIIGDKGSFESIFGNKNKQIHRLYPKLSEIQFDFEHYDFAFSFGRKILKLEYSKKISSEDDFCAYLKKIPVLPVYENGEGHTVYIYKILEKDIYRHQCP